MSNCEFDLFLLQQMVVVAQLVRASVCGTEGRRFEPGLPPFNFPLRLTAEGFFYFAAMDFHVYIIESETSGKFYIGQTNNLDKRIEYHNSGKSRYTKGKGPWKLVFKLGCETRSEAMKLERKIKNFKSRKRIIQLIKDNS